MSLHLRTQRWTSVALLVAAIILLVIVASIGLVSLTYHDLVLGGRWALHSEWLHGADIQSRAAALGQLGDYFGGTLNPILSFCGFLVLLVTVVLQRRQLEEGTRQLEQATRAIDLEAFVRVSDTLNAPGGLAAREHMLGMARDGRTALPPDQWAAADLQAAHTVARQFDLVGVLIEGRLFDANLFLRSWHHAVVAGWEACEPWVRHHRAQSGDGGFMRHFEELCVLARPCRPVVPERLGVTLADAAARDT
ncbi:hypothetical protein O4H66_10505 [Comamonadaceae bacterium G21597-S1]|nr:hypothetical protein [Comamonadaceae bacterium G21597-S1]